LLAFFDNSDKQLVKGNQPMNTNELIEIWKHEEQQLFIGWDFSYLDGRMIEEQAPWSYTSRAAELMRQASSVIDLGTGGGERLLKLKKYWPKKVVVTEDYPRSSTHTHHFYPG
jgi:hypothetical protein